MAWKDVDVIIDVGANAGQYGKRIRAAGYGGRIVSFEPLADAFRHLERAVAADPLWDCHRIALGARDGRMPLNVSGDLEASSLLPMEARHRRHCPPSAYVGTETVDVAPLDSLVSRVGARSNTIYLKLDVQGYELEVLRGARRVLSDTALIEAELSLVPLYTGGPLYREVIDHLDACGYELISVEGITEEPDTGHMLQLDAIFVR
jgi:FkbM family methyltransferase